MGKLYENLEIHDDEDNLIAIEKRKTFYAKAKKEFARKGKVSLKVKSIRLLLMNSSGRIYLQKRSAVKEQNAGLYDKTIGGHVLAGHTWYMTVVKECHEELGFPAVVLTEEEFRRAIKATDLSIIGLFRQAGYEPAFMSVRKTRNGDFVQPYMTTFYIGYYDGSIRFADGESTGIEVFSLKELETELKKHPEKFTEDLKYMIKHFRHYLVPVKMLK